MAAERQEDSSPGERAALLNRRSSSSLRASQDEENGEVEREQEGVPDGTAADVAWKGNKTRNIVLLLGVFLINCDSAILLAMFQEIASSFNQLGSAGWILKTSILGILIAQPLYGRLSDIYGRKPLLLIAYSLVCAGGLVSGLGFSFPGLLVGRTLSGFGNAGINTLISVLIVDLVPQREVPIWRSYVYTVNHIGRVVGPSLGALISKWFSWRWALIYHVPINILSAIYLSWKMSFASTDAENSHEPSDNSRGYRLGQIDFLGSFSLGATNICLLLFMEGIQQDLNNVNSPTSITLLSVFAGSLLVFIGTEAFLARQPILPLRMLTERNVFASYSNQFFQTAAQMSFYTSIPLYFKIAMGDSDAIISLRLLVITVGTIIGGLLSGRLIKSTGRHRLVTMVFNAISNISFIAVFFRWRGSTGWLETLYGFPIGLGFGVSLSSAFIALTADMDKSKVAVAISGFYLCFSLGSLMGISSASLINVAFVKKTLLERLKGEPDAAKIIRDVTSNINNINRLPSGIWEIVHDTYMESFVKIWLFSLISGCLGLVASMIMREGQTATRLAFNWAKKLFGGYNTFKRGTEHN